MRCESGRLPRRKPAAVVAVDDIYGHAPITTGSKRSAGDTTSLSSRIRRKRSGRLIEAARPGLSARLAVFSFNGNKTITTSGGGMLVSHDAELVERARFLATQAREKAPFYLHAT